MRFFIDNCLPKRVARALHALEGGFEVIHLQDKFAADTKDSVWMRELEREWDWVIVSRNDLYNDKEAEASLRGAAHVVFFLSKAWANLPLWEMASKLFHWWPRIVEESKKARKGAYYIVPPKGSKLEQINVGPR